MRTEDSIEEVTTSKPYSKVNNYNLCCLYRKSFHWLCCRERN